MSEKKRTHYRQLRTQFSVLVAIEQFCLRQKTPENVNLLFEINRPFFSWSCKCCRAIVTDTASVESFRDNSTPPAGMTEAGRKLNDQSYVIMTFDCFTSSIARLSCEFSESMATPPNKRCRRSKIIKVYIN